MNFRFIVFVLFPLLEFWLLLKFGAAFGALSAVALVVASALLGIAVLRLAGWQALLSGNARLRAGLSPAPELFSGFVLAIGGVLLLLPGLISDALGLLLLLPALRRWLAARLFGRMPVMAPGAAGAANDDTAGSGSGPVVIDGEFRREP